MDTPTDSAHFLFCLAEVGVNPPCGSFLIQEQLVIETVFMQLEMDPQDDEGSAPHLSH